jgi:hypothetical protein
MALAPECLNCAELATLGEQDGAGSASLAF